MIFNNGKYAQSSLANRLIKKKQTKKCTSTKKRILILYSLSMKTEQFGYMMILTGNKVLHTIFIL